MLSKAKHKLIRSLSTRKGREKSGLFVAEGPKVVGDLMAVARPEWLGATPEWTGWHDQNRAAEAVELTDDELMSVSFLQHPQQVVALFRLCDFGESQPRADGQPWPGGLVLALDGVRDPGNMGTIIRTADWFGIRHIFCSPDCADVFNPKVVQATMGSMARVRLIYTNLPAFVAALPQDVPAYGTTLDGEDLYAIAPAEQALIVMGNEGQGMSEEMKRCMAKNLTIPRLGCQDASGAESLNVGVATAIVCAEFRRKQTLLKS